MIIDFKKPLVKRKLVYDYTADVPSTAIKILYSTVCVSDRSSSYYNHTVGCVVRYW